MSRHVNDIIGQILFVVFFIIMGVVPLGILILGILILGILNFVRAITRRGTIVLQALGRAVDLGVPLVCARHDFYHGGFLTSVPSFPG